MSAFKSSKPTVLSPDAPLQGWGGLGVPGVERLGEDLVALTQDAVLTRGLARSYGDASLPPPGVREVVGTRLADRILAFDAATGLLRAEAGLSLTSLKRALLPRGWFVPVTPGTQFVTLGGMVASDVHGKNHHVAGTIGGHVLSLTMRLASGEICEVSRTSHPDLFRATLGGMGLTGHILDVTLQMARVPSPWIRSETFQVPELDTALDALEKSAVDWPMTVMWIDCLATGRNLGRGIMMRGKWATPDEAPTTPPAPGFSPTVPFRFPSFALNDLSMSAFNTLYYGKERWLGGRHIVSPDKWFYPLDAIHHWSRIYGRRGFTQHQSVIPKAAGRDAVRAYVERLAHRGGSSFLCVLKDCGAQGEGLLSFPEPGTSVALDLPIRADTPALIHELNRFVLDVGGRIYLSKDTFTSRTHFEAMEASRLPAFQAVRDAYDPQRKLRSALSVRLMGDPA